MSQTPHPPYLVIREGKAFWVETRSLGEGSATLQALDEDCYRDAWCYDAGGSRWSILAATLKEQPSLWERLFAWRRVPIRLEFGAPRPVDLFDVVSCLAKVLRSENAVL